MINKWLMEWSTKAYYTFCFVCFVWRHNSSTQGLLQLCAQLSLFQLYDVHSFNKVFYIKIIMDLWIQFLVLLNRWALRAPKLINICNHWSQDCHIWQETYDYHRHPMQQDQLVVSLIITTTTKEKKEWEKTKKINRKTPSHLGYL